MRVVEVRVPLSPSTSPTKVRETLLDASTLKAFHGPETDIGEWTGAERLLKYSLDATGSPIPLPRWVRVVARQRMDSSGVIRNSMRLEGLRILKIESAWSSTCDELVGRAEINVRVFPPFNRIAEGFVALKAKTQMLAYATMVSMTA